MSTNDDSKNKASTINIKHFIIFASYSRSGDVTAKMKIKSGPHNKIFICWLYLAIHVINYLSQSIWIIY